jgi:hypothetical protein
MFIRQPEPSGCPEREMTHAKSGSRYQEGCVIGKMDPDLVRYFHFARFGVPPVLSLFLLVHLWREDELYGLRGTMFCVWFLAAGALQAFAVRLLEGLLRSGDSESVNPSAFERSRWRGGRYA